MVFEIALSAAPDWAQSDESLAYQSNIYDTHPREPNTFDIIALGTEGGPFWNSATSFLLQCPYQSKDDDSQHNWISLDAGYLLDGVKDMGEKRLFPSFVDKGSQDSARAANLPIWSWWWQNRFKGGLISHSHLDHTGGMIISTQVNGKLSVNNKKRWFMNRKNLQTHIDHVFNEAVWPVIGGPGPDIIIPKGQTVPANGLSVTDIPPFPSKFGDKLYYNPFLTDFLNLLHHIPSEVAVDINGVTLNLKNYNGETLMGSCPYIVTEFPVNHGHVARSSAFLISYPTNPANMIMFFGDTGPDKLQPPKDSLTPETSHNLKHIWENIAEHRKNNLLSTIIIEVAMDDSTPDYLLFGHFKPSLFIEELVIMNDIFIAKGCTDGIEGMNFVIIHIKGSDKVKEGKEIRSVIMKQMQKHYAEKLGEGVLPELQFHYPTKFEHIRIDATGELLVLRKGISNDLESWLYGPKSVEADVATIMNENLDFYCGFIFGMMFITIIFIFYRTCKRRFHTDFYEPFGPEYEL